MERKKGETEGRKGKKGRKEGMSFGNQGRKQQ
jgi:hypothetical protein